MAVIPVSISHGSVIHSDLKLPSQASSQQGPGAVAQLVVAGENAMILLCVGVGSRLEVKISIIQPSTHPHPSDSIYLNLYQKKHN